MNLIQKKMSFPWKFLCKTFLNLLVILLLGTGIFMVLNFRGKIFEKDANSEDMSPAKDPGAILFPATTFSSPTSTPAPSGGSAWSMAAPLVEKNYSNQMIVVEEHHEVLQYWFQDATLPKSGVTLVHIDAHEDSALPPYIPNFPWFSWPKNKQELKLLMQRNDLFITGAVMSGLISRIINIWPSWDIETNKPKADQFVLGLGWYKPYRKRAVNKTREFCMCELRISGVQCFGPNYPVFDESRVGDGFLTADKEDEEASIRIFPSDCHLRVKIPVLSVQDIKAVNLLKTEKLVKKKDNIVLDIDEDFFGCEAAAKRFKEVGLEWSAVDRLDDLLSALFCVRTSRLEHRVDRFLTDIIHRQISAQQTSVQLKLQQISVQLKLMEFSRKWPQVFCSTNFTKTTQLMQEIMRIFKGLKLSQLMLLIKTGFCCDESPVTYNTLNPIESSPFKVCHGSTDPENDLVVYHIPTPQEIVQQSQNLEKILKLLPKPKQVTICRSFRDGYLPRDHFPQIEKSILSCIKKVFPNYNSVHYDQNLLGGPNGWFARGNYNGRIKRMSTRRGQNAGRTIKLKETLENK